MNATLEGQNCIRLPGFITLQRASALAEGFKRHSDLHPLAPDKQAPGSPALYDYLPFVRLLVEKIPDVEVACGERVLPTYAYARIYGHGETLAAHRDRDACELSLTLNLDGDQPWPIHVETPRGTTSTTVLEPGDALMYLGCTALHWRDPFPGTHCSQVFMHYVLSFGSRAHAYFDKRRTSP